MACPQEPDMSPGGRWVGRKVPAGERTGREQRRGEALPAKSQLPRGACSLSPEQTSSISIRRGLIIELGDFNGTGKFKCSGKYEYS